MTWQQRFGAAALAAVVGLASAVVGASAALGLHPARVAVATDERVAPAAAGQACEGSDRPAQGIAVHGHWTIAVFEPDGTPVAHHDFENALVPVEGERILTGLLARQRTAGHWLVALAPAGATGGPCSGAEGIAFDGSNGVYLDTCLLREATDPSAPAPTSFRTLTVSAPISGADANRLVLSGTATAAQNGSVGRVETILYRCQPDVAPSTCVPTTSSGGSAGPAQTALRFTSRVLDTPVSVSAGQVIQATVRISFS